MLHRCDVRYGQRWRVGNRTNEARKGMKSWQLWIAMGCRSRSARTRRTITKFAWSAMLQLLVIEAKPENLIGDRAYDSDPLDEELRTTALR